MTPARLAVTVLLLATRLAHADTLRLALPPAAAAAISRIVLRPFTAATHHGTRLVPTTAAFDVALLDPLSLADACVAGRVLKLDWAALGGRARFLPQATSDCGAGAALSATLLAWDPAKTQAHPSWADFWDVARLPGQRGLRQSPIGTLEIALMADGVAPRDVYAVLGGKDGPARAFRKLDQLRPYIVWWRHDTEPMRLVAAGNVLMSSAPSEQVIASTARLHRPFGLGWAGAIIVAQSWAVATATKSLPAAEALIVAATTPAAQAQLTVQTYLASPLAVDPKTLPADAVAAHLDIALAFDAAFWRDHRASLEKRFAVWLGQ